MERVPPVSTRTDNHFPYTPLFRSRPTEARRQPEAKRATAAARASRQRRATLGQKQNPAVLVGRSSHRRRPSHHLAVVGELRREWSLHRKSTRLNSSH